MDFELTDEQRLVQKTAADFAKNEVLPKAAEIDRNHRHPKELVARMAEELEASGGHEADRLRTAD